VRDFALITDRPSDYAEPGFAVIVIADNIGRNRYECKVNHYPAAIETP